MLTYTKWILFSVFMLIIGGIVVTLAILLRIYSKSSPVSTIIANSEGQPVAEDKKSDLAQQKTPITFDYSSATLIQGADGEPDDQDHQSQGNALALSLDGLTLAIGTPNAFKFTGEVYIFVYEVGTWVQQAALRVIGQHIVQMTSYGPLITDETGGFGYATSLSADGNTCICGAPRTNRSEGATYVFIRTGTSWALQAAFVGSDTYEDEIGVHTYDSNQGFSTALTYDGNTLAVGGYNYQDGIGAIWIFTRTNTTWTEQTRIVPTDSIGTSVFFGYQIALSGDATILVSGGYLDNSGDGAVWIYAHNGSSWTKQKKIITNSDVNTNQGRRVCISGDGSTIAYTSVSVDQTTINFSWFTPPQNNLVGKTYVYTNSGKGEWTLLSGDQNYYVAPYGGAVCLNHDASILYTSDAFTDYGKAYVYSRSNNSYVLQGSLQSNYIGQYTALFGSPLFGYPIVCDTAGTTVFIAASNQDKTIYPSFGATYVFRT